MCVCLCPSVYIYYLSIYVTLDMKTKLQLSVHYSENQGHLNKKWGLDDFRIESFTDIDIWQIYSTIYFRVFVF